MSGSSGECTFHVRFDIVTDRPVDVVLKHYEAAPVAGDGELYPDVSIGAYVYYDASRSAKDGAGYEYKTVIVELDAEYTGSGAWDLRCW